MTPRAGANICIAACLSGSALFLIVSCQEHADSDAGLGSFLFFSAATAIYFTALFQPARKSVLHSTTAAQTRQRTAIVAGVALLAQVTAFSLLGAFGDSVNVLAATCLTMLATAAESLLALKWSEAVTVP